MEILEKNIKTRKDKYGDEYPCSGEALSDVIARIREESKDKSDFSHKDEGTCVLGAGIKFDFLLTRERTTRSAFLFRAPYQGNVGSYKVLKPVLDYVKEKYPELKFYWDDGVMD